MYAREIKHVIDSLELVCDDLNFRLEGDPCIHAIEDARALIVKLVRERDYEEAMAWKQLNDLMADQMLRVVR